MAAFPDQIVCLVTQNFVPLVVVSLFFLAQIAV